MYKSLNVRDEVQIETEIDIGVEIGATDKSGNFQRRAQLE